MFATFPAQALARPVPRSCPPEWLGAAEGGLTAVLVGLRATYFLGMWVVTAYEAATIVGIPILYPAILTGLIAPEAAAVIYETASRGHVYLLPAVFWFLIYQGLPALAPR